MKNKRQILLQVGGLLALLVVEFGNTKTDIYCNWDKFILEGAVCFG